MTKKAMNGSMNAHGTQTVPIGSAIANVMMKPARNVTLQATIMVLGTTLIRVLMRFAAFCAPPSRISCSSEALSARAFLASSSALGRRSASWVRVCACPSSTAFRCSRCEFVSARRELVPTSVARLSSGMVSAMYSRSVRSRD
eukprot:scaffold39029_cov57-Phaeocystis_antarctica.AAC.3